VESEAASSRGRRRHVDDELGHLIGIYGSKELFINEYRNMLAERQGLTNTCPLFNST